MKKTFYILSFLFLITGCSDSNDSSDDLSPAEPHFYKGMDLSFQSELETYDVEYKDENGNPINLLDFVSENKANLFLLK